MRGVAKRDRIDINILVQLQKNGKLTNVELAQHVGLSPSPCLQRVKRLETGGYIFGYGARVNLSKLTQTITIFTEGTLAHHRRGKLLEVGKKNPQVYKVEGGHTVERGGR